MATGGPAHKPARGLVRVRVGRSVRTADGLCERVLRGVVGPRAWKTSVATWQRHLGGRRCRLGFRRGPPLLALGAIACQHRAGNAESTALKALSNSCRAHRDILILAITAAVHNHLLVRATSS